MKINVQGGTSISVTEHVLTKIQFWATKLMYQNKKHILLCLHLIDTALLLLSLYPCV